MNPTVLLVDTSEACHVAIVHEQKIIASAQELQSRQHADALLTLITRVLEDARMTPQALDAVAVLNGPGAFTGLRIGVSMVQGLSYGWGLPCVPVNTLEAWAYGVQNAQRVVCVMDARMGEVYAGCYDVDSPEPVLAPCCIAPEALDFESLCADKPVTLVGSGVLAYEAHFKALAERYDLELRVQPMGFLGFQKRAIALYEEGKTVAPKALDAIYLRPPVKQG